MKNSIQETLSGWQSLIWDTAPDKLHPALRPFITALRIAQLLVRDLLDGQLTLRSMSLVYTTLLAMVPLLALSFSVLKGFGVHNQLEPIMLNLFAPLGERGIEITNRIIVFVDNIKVGVLGSLGLGLLVYTVISLLQKIERAFNYAWRVSENRPMAQRFSDYLSVILIGPVLVFSALGITASVSSLALVKEAAEIEAIGSLIKVLGKIVPYVLIITAFTFIYVFVPNTKVKLKSALVGGVVSGVLWETTGWGFATFVVSSTRYTAIYSAFATLIMFMIWLYLSWLILLIGSSVAFYHQHPEHRNLRSRILRLSNRMREKVSLLIMTLIGKRHYNNEAALTVEALSEQLNIGVEACELLIRNLVAAGLLVQTADEQPTYVPAQSTETLKLTRLLAAVRRAEESSSLKLELLPQEPGADDLYAEIESAIDGVLGERTLRDLITR